MNPLAPIVKIVLIGGRTRDPALADDMDFKAYEDQRDEKLIKVKPGMTPTFFHVQQLKRTFVIDQIDTLSHWSQQFRLAFNAACHRVEPVGRPAMTPGDDWVTEKGAVPRIAGDSWIEQFDDDFELQAIYEVGAFAINEPACRRRPTPLYPQRLLRIPLSRADSPGRRRMRVRASAAGRRLSRSRLSGEVFAADAPVIQRRWRCPAAGYKPAVASARPGRGMPAKRSSRSSGLRA
jgi:hypothetical protein